MASALLECTGCGATFPVLGRVPVMFQHVALPPNPGYAAETTARDLLSAFHLSTDALSVLRMRRLIAQQPAFGNAQVRTEAAQFIHRVRSSGHSVGAAAGGASVGRNVPLIAQPGVTFLRDYIPRIMRPGGYLTANVRFRNTGAVPLRHAPPGNTTLALRWLTDDGRALENAEDVRAPLPLDVQPNQELTLPVVIKVPQAEGRFRLRLVMVEEGIGWLDDDAVEIPVSVRQGAWAEAPAGWQVDPDTRLDYGADHRRAAEMLRGWIAGLNVRQPKVLEIGGNAYPAIADLPGELHNVDVDLLGLQVGCLVQDRMELERRGGGSRVRHVCADADDLPYPEGYFDAIVMFATLHHFPDPTETLGQIAPKLRPGGFIGLLCEPVGHIDPGAIEAGFLAELERGVNEQSFVMREWAEIIRSAGLRVAEAVVEGGSLKARLVRAPDTAVVDA